MGSTGDCAVGFKKNELKRWLKKRWRIGKIDGEHLAPLEGILEIYELSYGPSRPFVCFDERPYHLLALKKFEHNHWLGVETFPPWYTAERTCIWRPLAFD